MYEFSLTIGQASFRIVSDWSEPIEQLKKLYIDYPKPQIVDFTVRLEAKNLARRFIHPSVVIDGDFMLPESAPLPLRHGLLGAEMGMNLQMALGWYHQLILHASSVEKDGRSLIMTGESGSGKSTLSAILGNRGWRFMGDEFAFIDIDTGHAWPHPRLISLKNESIATMEKEAPNAVFGPLMKDTPKGDIRHLLPPIDAIQKMGQSAPPKLLLFPSYGQKADIRPAYPSETFVLLTLASSNYTTLGEAGYEALKRFILEVPAYAIDYETGDEAIDMINELWDQL